MTPVDTVATPAAWTQACRIGPEAGARAWLDTDIRRAQALAASGDK